ncbi:MAG: hypothetical protein ABI165_01415, partial [Bryobacteraceae bacterium]
MGQFDPYVRIRADVAGKHNAVAGGLFSRSLPADKFRGWQIHESGVSRRLDRRLPTFRAGRNAGALFWTLFGRQILNC